MAISGLFLTAQELAQTKGLGKYLESKHPERQIPQDFSVTTSVTVLAPCSEPAPAPVAFLCSQTCFGVHVSVSSLFLLLWEETGLGTEKGEGALLGSDGQRVPHAVSLPGSPKASSVAGTSLRAFPRLGLVLHIMAEQRGRAARVREEPVSLLFSDSPCPQKHPGMGHQPVFPKQLSQHPPCSHKVPVVVLPW